jgi:hypothetical protein
MTPFRFHQNHQNPLMGESMLKRIWCGEITVGWAFWGVGLGGLFPVFAIILGFWGTFVLTALLSSTTSVPSYIRAALSAGLSTQSLYMFWFPFLLGAILIFQTVSIWRSSSRHSSKLWRGTTKGIVMLSWLFVFTIPPVTIVSFLLWAFTPERYVDTSDFKEQAPAFFEELTNLPYPEGVTIAQVSWYRIVEEFGHHLVLDASNINLDEWLRTSKPFGKPMERITPERSIELNADGLTCNEPDTKVDPSNGPNHPLVIVSCELMTNPREIWMAQHRHRSDWMRTIIVDEKYEMIWLQETEW